MAPRIPAHNTQYSGSEIPPEREILLLSNSGGRRNRRPNCSPRTSRAAPGTAQNSPRIKRPSFVSHALQSYSSRIMRCHGPYAEPGEQRTPSAIGKNESLCRSAGHFSDVILGCPTCATPCASRPKSSHHSQEHSLAQLIMCRDRSLQSLNTMGPALSAWRHVRAVSRRGRNKP